MSDNAGREFLDQASQSLNSGKMLEALDFAQQAISLDAENGEAHMIAGIALSQLGRAVEAEQSFNRAVELIPTNPKVYYNMAVHYYGTGKKQEAYKTASKVLELDPTHASARDLVIRLESELGLRSTTPPAATAGPTSSAVPPMRPESMYQPGYEPPIHSIQFVQNLGSSWDLMGWIVLIIRGLVAIINYLIVIPKMMELFSNPELMAKAQRGQAAQFMNSPLQTALSYIGYGLLALLMIWTIMDIIDRKSNWVWIIPFVVCCCFSLEWIAVIIYIIYGRPKLTK